MGRFGYDTTAEEVARTVDLRGRRAVVTGASSGIGMETTRALALAGADVVLGVRDPDKGEGLVHELAPDASGELRVVPLDLRDLASVSTFADAVTGPVDLLLANVECPRPPMRTSPTASTCGSRRITSDTSCWRCGCTRRCAERGARIVVVSSAAHKGAPVRLDDLQWQSREHVAGMAYAESKSANILFAQEATRRWSPDGIFANAVLPGSALTGLQRFHGEELKRQIGFIFPDGSPNPILKTPAQAAATTLWAATAPELEGRGGLVLEDCAEARPVGPDTHPWCGFDASVADPDTARRLWDHSLDLLHTLGVDA